MAYLIVFSLPAFIVAYLLYSLRKDKKEQQTDRKLQESLEDETIYDPETGVKLTLEEAESGRWLAHDNAGRVKSDDELEKYYEGTDLVIERIINNLKEAGYKKAVMSEADDKELEGLAMFTKYDDWHFSDPYSCNNMLVLFPQVTMHPVTRHDPGFRQVQLLVRVKTDNEDGHYYLREKTAFEDLLDQFKSDDDLKTGAFECYTFKPSNQVIYLNNLLRAFEDETDLDIEIVRDHLFIKTTTEVNMERFKTLKQIVEGIH